MFFVLNAVVQLLGSCLSILDYFLSGPDDISYYLLLSRKRERGKEGSEAVPLILSLNIRSLNIAKIERTTRPIKYTDKYFVCVCVCEYILYILCNGLRCSSFDDKTSSNNNNDEKTKTCTWYEITWCRCHCWRRPSPSPFSLFLLHHLISFILPVVFFLSFYVYCYRFENVEYVCFKIEYEYTYTNENVICDTVGHILDICTVLMQTHWISYVCYTIWHYTIKSSNLSCQSDTSIYMERQR